MFRNYPLAKSLSFLLQENCVLSRGFLDISQLYGMRVKL